MKYKTLLALIPILFIFTACANKIELKPNKVVKDISKLKPSIYNENTYYYIKEDTDFSKYNKVIVPKIDVYTQNDKEAVKKIAKDISNYFTINLQKEIQDTLKNRRLRKNSLILQGSIVSLDLSYDNLEIYQYLPYGLAFTAIKRTTGIEEKKIRTNFVLKVLDEKTNELLAIVVEHDITNTEVNNLDELNIDNLKPILDKWIAKYKLRITELKEGKYKI